MILSEAEIVDGREITGWALDRQHMDDRLLIEAFFGERIIAVTTADIPQGDEPPGNQSHGFRMVLHKPLPPEQIPQICLYATGRSGERVAFSIAPHGAASAVNSAAIERASGGGGGALLARSTRTSTAAWHQPVATTTAHAAALLHAPTARPKEPSASTPFQDEKQQRFAASRPGRRTAESPIDIFVHIPKSGGSTIRTILSREYGVSHISYIEPGVSHDGSLDGLTSHIRSQFEKKEIHLFTGHQPYGLHSIIKKYCRYFSMLRDPIDRAISDYYYAFHSEDHRHRQKILSGELTVADFVTSPSYGFINAQMRMLALTGPGYNSSAEAVIENARLGFAFVGTTERFDESILLLAKILRWRPPIYMPANITRLDTDLRAARDRARQEAQTWCYEIYKHDIQVYRAVDQMLSARVEQEGDSFVLALEAFREIEADISREAGNEVHRRYDFKGDLDSGLDLETRYTGSDAYQCILDYLESDGPAPDGRNYVGCVDHIDGNTVRGWAADLARDGPIEVSVRVGGQAVARVTCGNLRDDLVRAGYPRANLGFEITLDAALRDYSICFEDTSLLLPGSPGLPGTSNAGPKLLI